MVYYSIGPGAGRDLCSSERRGRAPAEIERGRRRIGGRTPGSARRPADLAIGSGIPHLLYVALAGSRRGGDGRRGRDGEREDKAEGS
jgi:hypothetical protein